MLMAIGPRLSFPHADLFRLRKRVLTSPKFCLRRRVVQQGSRAVVARSALCVCMCECAGVHTCDRTRARARGVVRGWWSDQMCMCVCMEEHVLRGGSAGESTAGEVSGMCARGRQCSAMCGREEACVCQHSFLSYSRHSISQRRAEAFVTVAAGAATTDADDEGCPD